MKLITQLDSLGHAERHSFNPVNSPILLISHLKTYLVLMHKFALYFYLQSVDQWKYARSEKGLANFFVN